MLCISTLSASSYPRYQGLLTNGYGIITESDLDEAGQLESWRGFTGNELDHYWQCLEPTDYHFVCENLRGAEFEGSEIGEPTFWIKANGRIYHFGTRRNWDMAHCEDMKKDILWLMNSQSAVCISGTYVRQNSESEYWILDRLKSPRGAWSWFARPGYNMALPSSFSGP